MTQVLRLDAHLVESLKIADFFNGLQGVGLETIFMPGDGISLPATTQFIGGNTFDVRYDVDRSDPKQLEELHRLEQEGEIEEIRLKFNPGFKKNRS